jgi:POT family proton-dependent oligopeptide transporter
MWAIYIKIYSNDEGKVEKADKTFKYSGIALLFFTFFAILSYVSSGPIIPASWFQNINPIAILIFASLFSVMWLKLDAINMNPRTPIKFALGMFFGSIAFWVMSMASDKAIGGHLVSPMWLVAVYVILTIGELMLSPIGLSMITKLAPKKLVSVVMGLWMASFAAGNYIAGMLESILHKYDLPLYPFISALMLATGIVIVLISPLLNKAMKGIH